MESLGLERTVQTIRLQADATATVKRFCDKWKIKITQIAPCWLLIFANVRRYYVLCQPRGKTDFGLPLLSNSELFSTASYCEQFNVSKEESKIAENSQVMKELKVVN